MKKVYTNLLLLFTSLLVIFNTNSARADYAAAAELSYRWISDSTYMLTYVLYKDCGGATAEPNRISVCYYNTCNTDNGKAVLDKKTPLSNNGLPVKTLCSGTESTTCTTPAGTLKGFRKWVYEGRVTLPSKCDNWRFIVSLASRNTGITNWAGTLTNLHTEASLNNIDAPRSSSPSFSEDLIQYMCAGMTQSYHYGGTDPDGDVLSYALIAPTTAADNQVTCIIPPTPVAVPFGGSAPGTSLLTDPFAASNTFVLEPADGTMSFVPNVGTNQQAQMTLQVTQTRGTKVVGTTMRDIQFIISNGCASAGVDMAITSSTGILYIPMPPTSANALGQVCPNEPFSLCFTLSSSDPSVTISNVKDNHTTFSPTAGSTANMGAYTTPGTNAVSACFNWTPTEEDEGLRYLIIESEVCKPGNPKINRRDTFFFDVIRTAKVSASDTFICFGEVARLCGSPVDDPATASLLWVDVDPVTYAAGPGLFISTPTAPCTDVNPLSTTTYVFTTDEIPNFCQRKDNPLLNTNQAEFKVVVVNPRISAGPDTIVCIYSQLQLNSNLLNPQPELGYHWSWSPGTWLDDSTSATPILSFPPGTDPTSIPDSVDIYLICTPYALDTAYKSSISCIKIDTVRVHFLKGFYITTGDQLGDVTGLGHQGRQKGRSDTLICNGQTITLQGWADQRLDYTWTPTTGVSTPTAFVPGALTITPTGTTSYYVTASKPGCPDSTKEIRIIVEQTPTVNVGPDRTICFGDSTHLTAEITPDVETYTDYTFLWEPGGSLARTDTFFTYFTGYISERIKFTVTTKAGCSGSDELVINVEPRKFLTPGPDTSICPGDAVKISVAGDPLLQSVTWKPGKNIDSIHSLTPIVSPLYSQEYVVIGLDSNHCLDSTSVKVTVLPNAVIYLPDTVTIYPGDVYQLEPTGNCLYYSWFPPAGLDDASISDPKASPALNTTYYVNGRTELGCMARDSIYILVAPDSHIEMPNAFAPGKGESGTFKPIHMGETTLKSFAIYNRWGLKVFETTNLNEGWDGTYGGQPQPLGVYVYVLEAVTARGRIITKQGNVTLIR